MSETLARRLVIPKPQGLAAVRLTLPEPPSANRWWRKWKNRMVLSTEARDYKAFVLVKAVASLGFHRSAFPLFRPQPVAVTITWDRKRKSGDLDKRLGVLLDSLQGIAYQNDSQIVKLVATRTDHGTGTVEVLVEAWS